MTTPVIAFVGAGNMGSSLIAGLIQNDHPADQIWAADPSEEKLLALKEQLGVHITTNNNEAVDHADVVIFAIEPSHFAEVATALAPVLMQKKPLVISVAAGIRESTIQKWLGDNMPIVRVMPNTPALVGCGAAALYANSHVSATQHNIANVIMNAVGIAVWVKDEKQMDAITALSGSGPAYFFLFMEALEDAAIELGLDEEMTHILTQQTALGAACMVIENEMPIAELRERVTSKGGTTEKGLSVLEQHKIRDIIKKTLSAAKKRSEELGELN